MNPCMYLLLAILVMSQVTQITGQAQLADGDALMVAMNGDVSSAASNDSVEIPIQVVPGSKLGLPSGEIQIDSEDADRPQVPAGKSYRNDDPDVNEEVIVEGDPESGTLLFLGPADNSTATSGGDGITSVTPLVLGNTAVSSVDPNSKAATSTEAVTTDTTPKPDGGANTNNRPPGETPNVDNPNGEGDGDAGGHGKKTPAQLEEEAKEQARKNADSKKSKTGLWIVLGVLVLIDFLLIIVFTILQVGKKRPVDRLPVNPMDPKSVDVIPKVEMKRPTGGWAAPVE